MILAIDPGACTGWAIFLPGVGLHSAGVCTVDDLSSPMFDTFAPRHAELVIEIPQVYRAALSKGDPNDLIKVAVQAGRWIERAKLRGWGVREVHPTTWKGQIPKEIHHARIENALLADERARASSALSLPKSKRHNALDAIGLGLFHLGRGR